MENVDKILLIVAVIGILTVILLIQPIKLSGEFELKGSAVIDMNTPTIRNIDKIKLTGIRGNIEVEAPFFVYLLVYGSTIDTPPQWRLWE